MAARRNSATFPTLETVIRLRGRYRHLLRVQLRPGYDFASYRAWNFARYMAYSSMIARAAWVSHEGVCAPCAGRGPQGVRHPLSPDAKYGGGTKTRSDHQGRDHVPSESPMPTSEQVSTPNKLQSDNIDIVNCL